eukprot:jgi/Chlat1/2078/Chrsp17S02632
MAGPYQKLPGTEVGGPPPRGGGGGGGGLGGGGLGGGVTSAQLLGRFADGTIKSSVSSWSSLLSLDNGGGLREPPDNDDDAGSDEPLLSPVALSDDGHVRPGAALVRSVSGHARTVDLCVAYENGRRAANVPYDTIRKWAVGGDKFVWIGMHDPDLALLHRIAKIFKLHELLVEDALERDPRPKLERYDDSYFITVRTAAYGESGRVEFGDIDIVVEEGAIISISQHPMHPFFDVQVRAERRPYLLKMGVASILYWILYWVIETYVALIRRMRTERDELENRVFEDQDVIRSDIQRLYKLRADCINVRRAVRPLVEICARLVSGEAKIIVEGLAPYFRNLYYNASQLKDEIDVLIETLSFAFDAGALLSDATQQTIQKKLAAWGAILVLPTMIAGIYGMNFDYMPELQWKYGYLFYWGVTATICTILAWFFKQANWL